MQVIPFHDYAVFGAYCLLTILGIGLMASSPLTNSKLVVYALYTIKWHLLRRLECRLPVVTCLSFC